MEIEEAGSRDVHCGDEIGALEPFREHLGDRPGRTTLRQPQRDVRRPVAVRAPLGTFERRLRDLVELECVVRYRCFDSSSHQTREIVGDQSLGEVTLDDFDQVGWIERFGQVFGYTEALTLIDVGLLSLGRQEDDGYALRPFGLL